MQLRCEDGTHKLVGTASGLSGPQILLMSSKVLPFSSPLGQCGNGQIYRLPSTLTFYCCGNYTRGLTKD